MQKSRRPTIRDVAREAGFGTTTVSRVINGGKLVAPAVRVRVEEVIRQLGFQPSDAARSLAQEKSHSIGLIVPRLTDPFFSSIASVAQSICRANRHVLLISTSLDLEEQALEELRVFDRRRVDGLIVVPPANQTALFRTHCRQMSGKVVAVDLPLESGVSSVQTDNAEATAKATRHLLEHGRKRILFLGTNPNLHTMLERRRGYTEEMVRAGLTPAFVEHINSFESAEEAIMQAMRKGQGIDGVLTANGTLGIYAFQILQKHNIAFPEKLGFITFDDFALADMLRPSVTCVAQPISDLGRAATELLFTQLSAARPRTRHLQLASELVLRESCGCKNNISRHLSSR